MWVAVARIWRNRSRCRCRWNRGNFCVSLKERVTCMIFTRSSTWPSSAYESTFSTKRHLNWWVLRELPKMNSNRSSRLTIGVSCSMGIKSRNWGNIWYKMSCLTFQRNGSTSSSQMSMKLPTNNCLNECTPYNEYSKSLLNYFQF